MNIMRVKRKCLELISRIEEEGAYSHLVLQQASESREVSAEEFPVLLQLTRGVLEQRGLLELKLNPFLPKGLDSLPVEIRNILRLGAYQILFLDRVKKRDVVYEAVELAKGGKYRGLAKLVNAVLRKIGPDDLRDSGEEVPNSTLNFPEWLIKRWSNQFSEELVKDFCAASDKPLPVYCRVNTIRTTPSALKDLFYKKDGIESEISVFSPHSLKIIRIPPKKRLTGLEAYRKGLFFIQDLSSTIVSDIVALNNPQSVRDLCAAPGGKSCSIALSIGARGGRVYATDKSARRVGLIDDLVARLGLKNIATGVFNLGDTKERASKLYDMVLLDGPCSGFGTVGKKVDARWTTSYEGLLQLTKAQSFLLDAAARFVNPGGYLVYSTCTIDREENEERIFSFLESHRDFELIRLNDALSPELCTTEGFYRSWPQNHSMTGAFAALIRRNAVRAAQ
jgi:16S rRNA (cytosine967-C5)-methyltransferase